MYQRVIILCDGKSTRWTLPTPKQLTIIRGEPVLHRTVNQLRDRGQLDIWITSHDERLRVAGTAPYAPSNNQHKIDQFYACHPIWRGIDRLCGVPVTFLYGDVRFSDAAINTILNHPVADFAYFQRTHGSKITGKIWKEGFAMKVRDTELLFNACSHIRAEIVAGRETDQHHQLQGYLEGRGTGRYFEEQIGPHGVEIDDETEDFDCPTDVVKWLLATRPLQNEHSRTP